MPSEFVGIIGLVMLLLFLALGVPIGINMMLIGFSGLWLLTGFNAATTMLATRPYAELASFGWVVLPLFLLMGEFAVHGRIGEDAFEAGIKWLGRFPAGLAMSTTLANALFSAISGSTLAANVVFSKVALPEMMKRNYDAKLATGCLVAAGTLAIMIPPSSVLVIYGMLTNTSIAKVLIGGYLPGLLMAALYMAMIFIRVKLNPRLAPEIPARSSWREKFNSIGGLSIIILIVVLMIGGMFTGVFTASEAAAFGAFATLVVVICRKRLTRERIISSLSETAKVTGMLFIIIIGANVFTRFMAVSQITAGLADAVSGIPPIGVVLLFCFVMAIMGMFIDPIGMMTLSLPIFFPVVQGMGINEVWFGILVVATLELGGMSPPFALNVFAVKAVVGDLISLQDIFRGVVPFVIMETIAIAIIIIFPSIATWLPSLIWQTR